MATFLPACIFSVDPAAPRYLTAALYQFVDLPDFAELRAPLQALCESHGVRGMLLLAHEGINGTIAGPAEGVQAVLAWLRKDPRFAALQHKEAATDAMPFYRMRVRLKKEIVTLGVPGLNPARNAGTYVKPEDWNALIDDPGVVVIDTRNDYEVGIGTFDRAINPHTRSFSEFPAWVAEQSQPGGVLAGNPKDPQGCLMTTFLGVLGAVLFSWIGQATGMYARGESAGFIGAVIGALLLLGLWRMFSRR